MPLRRSRTSSLLNDLIDWSVIIFRKHVGSFAIYAGSDFDIEAAVDKARQLGVGVDYRRLARYATLQPVRSEEHTSELQSLMRISYAVFCLTKKTQQPTYSN